MKMIKICGTTTLEDATLAWQFGADAIGFVVAPRSKRHVSVDQVREIIDQLARPIERIAVTLDLQLEELLRVYRESGVSGLQLHGNETPDLVRELRQRLPEARIIKVLHAHSCDRLKQALDLYATSGVDTLLIDNTDRHSGLGGTGSCFDWSEVAATGAIAGSSLPVLIAGGLTPANVAAAVRTLHPFGVDVVTGVESATGKKDRDKLRAFIAAARAAAAPSNPAKVQSA